jgi:protein-S-isoprenylcysteine O-methyltransferase Ste14
MRHPSYFVMLTSIPASALAIGFWFALVPAIVFALVLAQRTGREDEFLSYNLPVHAEYANHVSGRLFPIKKPKKDLYVKHSA